MAILFGRDQLPVFLSFLVCGALEGILYDVLKIKRRIFGAPYVVLFVDDLLFTLSCAILVIFNAFAFNDGNLKWYELPFLTAGFVIYRLTLSRLFILVCFTVIDFFKRLIYAILAPVKKLFLTMAHILLSFMERVYFAVFIALYRRKMFRFCKLSAH